jgi:hypothetical protein
MANTNGRRRNSAQPLGEQHGIQSKDDAARTAQAERKSAGPDGPSAREVGDTFKR